MTVANESLRVIYAGNGIATEFPYTFRITEPYMPYVWLQDPVTFLPIAVLGPSEYSITGINKTNMTGGEVTYNPVSGPLPIGTNIVIERRVNYTQLLDLVNQGGFFPESIEYALDMIVFQTQQLADLADRSMIVEPGQDAPNISELLDLIEDAIEAANIAVAHAQGNLVFSTHADFIASSIEPVANSVYVAGYYSAGDVGAKYMHRIATPGIPTAVQFQIADGSWWQISNAVKNPAMIGAKVDGVTNDNAAYAALIAYCNGTGEAWYVPLGVSVINAVHTCNSPVVFQGVLKCGYNHLTAGLRLTRQPFDVNNYLRIYCDGDLTQVNAAAGGSPDMGTATVRAMIYDWLTSQLYFNLDFAGRRININDEIQIDPDLVAAQPGSFNYRKYFGNVRLQSDLAMAGGGKYQLHMKSSSGTVRAEAYRFDKVTFAANGRSGAFRVTTEYLGITFTNCEAFFCETRLFSFENTGGSSSDVNFSNCHFYGDGDKTGTGIYKYSNDLLLTHCTIRSFNTNLHVESGGQVIISNSHFYGDGVDVGGGRRSPNILLENTRSATINGCYIDNQPIQIKSNTTGAFGYTTITNNFFVANGSRAATYAFIEINGTAGTPTIANMTITGNRFSQPTGAVTITAPMQNVGVALGTTTGNNSIKDNQFLFVTKQSSEIQRNINFAATVGPVADTPPAGSAPFGFSWNKIKSHVQQTSDGNPGGLRNTFSGGTWNYRVGTAVTAEFTVIYTTNADISA